MRIVIAPDSFKGSLSAQEFCNYAKKGILRVYPSASIQELPLADGGEGISEYLVHITKGQTKHVEVRGPLGKPVKAGIGLLGDRKTAVIEMAQSSGLPLLKKEVKNPYFTSSYGTGELLKKALDLNYRNFIIGLGGSATNDAGVGMLKALGAKFFKQNGENLQGGGKALLELAYFDDSNLGHRLKESNFTIASDVTNPLCGPDGASVVFGPQKGASSQQVTILDNALNQLSKVILKQKNLDLREIKGGGAAGGVGAMLMAFTKANMKPGIEVFMEMIEFESMVQGAELIITGEGKLDEQTFSGKVIEGVSNVAQNLNIPVIALCGEVQINQNQIEKLGLLGAFTVVPGPCSIETALTYSPEWLTDRTEQIISFMKNSQQRGVLIET